MELHLFLYQRENPLDVDFNRAKELMMKKHLLMHQ
jgi:hypothetical protein